MPAVMRRQRLSQPPQGRFAPAAQRPAHDASLGPLNGQPEPRFVLFMPHKGPQCIEFEYFPPLALDVG